jgi:hypothetical protein
MKTFFNLTLLLFVFNSCNSQPLNASFINSISTSVKKSFTTSKKTQGKISITYPINLSTKFQKIIDDYILEDLKLESCEGVDSKIQIRYEIKYNSDDILSVFKIEDYVMCDVNDYTQITPFVLYSSNGNIYNVSINESLNTKTVIENFINVSNKNDNSQCNYANEDINKYLIIDNKQIKLFLIKDSVFCFGEVNLNLQEDMIKFDIVN